MVINEDYDVLVSQITSCMNNAKTYFEGSILLDNDINSELHIASDMLQVKHGASSKIINSSTSQLPKQLAISTYHVI